MTIKNIINDPEKFIGKIYGEKIREGRVARGLTIKELSEKLNMSRQFISNCEKGINQPSAITIEKIADILNFPMNFFTMPDTDISTNTSIILFRAKAATPKMEQEMAKIRFKWDDKIYKYFSKYLNLPLKNIPKININRSFNGYSYNEIKKIVLELRKYWCLGDLPINNITRTLEKNGFAMMYNLPNIKLIDGLSQTRDRVPFILINNNDKTVVRKRYTVAHELGHSILHSDISPEIANDKQQAKRLDKEADLFAGEFLLPEDSFKYEVYTTNINCFIQLKRRWKVSIQAMIKRCETLNILSPNQTRYLFYQISSNHWRKKEPLDDVIPHEEPALFKESLQVLLEENIVDAQQICNALPYTTDELAMLLNVDEEELKPNKNIISLKDKKYDNFI